MASADGVQICNIALRRVQGEPITDLETDDTKSAVLCRTLFEPARDAVLRDHPWSFAIKRQLMASSTATNLTRWLYSYVEPSDPYCLRPLVLLDAQDFYNEMTGYPYQEESRIIYTDLYAAGLKYIARITDVSQWDDNFVDAIAWRLAADLLKPIEGSSAVDLWMMYERALMIAKGNNDLGAQEPPLPPSSWVDSRFAPRSR